MGRVRAALLSLALGAAAGPVSGDPPKAPAQGPPYDVTSPTPHSISMVVDTGPARDFLELVAATETAPAALRRLRESRPVLLALERENRPAEQFFGRLVAYAAGTPDPFLSVVKSQVEPLRKLLDALETEGTGGAVVEARRIASLLPPSPAVTARLSLVPFFGLGGFSDVQPVAERDQLFLLCDLPRILADSRGTTPPRESVLKLLRAGASEAWRNLFERSFRTAPGWAAAPEPGFDALAAQTVADGVAMLFLVPDEFFPLPDLFSEPIERAFVRWNAAAERLLDPAVKPEEKRDLLREGGQGDFWSRYPAVVGAQAAEAILRRPGREAFARALGEGPRSVLALYVSLGEKKLPAVSKTVRRALAP